MNMFQVLQELLEKLPAEERLKPITFDEALWFAQEAQCHIKECAEAVEKAYLEYHEAHPGPHERAKPGDTVGNRVNNTTATDLLGRPLSESQPYTSQFSFWGYRPNENTLLFGMQHIMENGQPVFEGPPRTVHLPNPAYGDADLGRGGKIHVIWATSELLIYQPATP